MQGWTVRWSGKKGMCTLRDLGVATVFGFSDSRYRLTSVSRPTCALSPVPEVAPGSSRPSKHSKALFSRPDQRLTVSVRAHTLPTDPAAEGPAGKPMRPPRNPAEKHVRTGGAVPGYAGRRTIAMVVRGPPGDYAPAESSWAPRTASGGLVHCWYCRGR